MCSYSLYHASRKTLSNVKTSAKAVWTREQTEFDNRSLVPADVWQRDTYLFDSNDSATQFLGALDAIFMSAYAVVSVYQLE
jgi:hypothetical protein